MINIPACDFTPYIVTFGDDSAIFAEETEHEKLTAIYSQLLDYVQYPDMTLGAKRHWKAHEKEKLWT